MMAEYILLRPFGDTVYVVIYKPFSSFVQSSLKLVFCWLKGFLWKQLLPNTSKLNDNDSPEWAKTIFDSLEVVPFSVDVGNSENERERSLTFAKLSSMTKYIVYAMSLTKQHS